MVKNDLIELRRIYLGFQASRVVLTANNLRVFEYMKKPISAARLAGRLKTDERATEILLDALCGIGLAAKSRAGTYRNTPLSNKYLIRNSRSYQGDIVRHASTMWENWSGLDDVLKTGRPARRATDMESFILGMHNLSLTRAPELIKAIGLKGVKSALDLGGGPGTNAMEMAKRGVQTTLFDRAEALKLARGVMRREGVKGIKSISGDFQVDSIGSGYDLILISQIFHAYSERDNIALLEKCRAALNPDGRVAVQEFPIDDSRTAPPHSTLFSVNMLVGTEHGRCYSPKEIRGWLLKTGFKKAVVKKLSETVLIEATARG